MRITILSAYGKWRYFTLTQIKIRGKGLFADALTEITDKKYMSQGSTQETMKKVGDTVEVIELEFMSSHCTHCAPAYRPSRTFRCECVIASLSPVSGMGLHGWEQEYPMGSLSSL